MVLIVETPVFRRRVLKLMSDEDYRELQQTLVGDPERGAIIRHSSGLRKIRWARLGRSKRGGVRAILGSISRDIADAFGLWKE